MFQQVKEAIGNFVRLTDLKETLSFKIGVLGWHFYSTLNVCRWFIYMWFIMIFLLTFPSLRSFYRYPFVYIRRSFFNKTELMHFSDKITLKY